MDVYEDRMNRGDVRIVHRPLLVEQIGTAHDPELTSDPLIPLYGGGSYCHLAGASRASQPVKAISSANAASARRKKMTACGVHTLGAASADVRVVSTVSVRKQMRRWSTSAAASLCAKFLELICECKAMG